MKHLEIETTFEIKGHYFPLPKLKRLNESRNQSVPKNAETVAAIPRDFPTGIFEPSKKTIHRYGKHKQNLDSPNRSCNRSRDIDNKIQSHSKKSMKKIGRKLLFTGDPKNKLTAKLVLPPLANFDKLKIEPAYSSERHNTNQINNLELAFNSKYNVNTTKCADIPIQLEKVKKETPKATLITIKSQAILNTGKVETPKNLALQKPALIQRVTYSSKGGGTIKILMPQHFAVLKQRPITKETKHGDNTQPAISVSPKKINEAKVTLKARHNIKLAFNFCTHKKESKESVAQKPENNYFRISEKPEEYTRNDEMDLTFGDHSHKSKERDEEIAELNFTTKYKESVKVATKMNQTAKRDNLFSFGPNDEIEELNCKTMFQ